MRLGGIAVIGLAMTHCGLAFAQSAPTEDPAQAPATVQGVTVTGERSRTTRTIDRKIYNAGSDLQSSGGSASDLLKNVPSVDVDSDGNVTLRGDANVQILVDGKPSAQMNADRAAALEQLPADQIERIEVIDNPSAANKADGSAGVINIVTKKTRRPGVTGALSANLGDQGRRNMSLTASRRTGKLTVYGGLSIRHDVRKRLYDDHRESIDPTTQAASRSHVSRVFETRRFSPTLTGGAEYNWTKSDQLSASFSYNDRFGSPVIREHDTAFAPGGATISDFTRDAPSQEHEVNSDYQLKWRHSFPGEDHTLELALHQSESDEHQRRTYTDVFAIPVGPNQIDNLAEHQDELTREISLDYSAPLPGGAQLQAGYDFERDDDFYDNHDTFVDPVTGALTPNPALTDRFHYRQSIHALYGTWKRSFDRLTVMGGVRLEQAYVDIDQNTTGQTATIRYFRVHPSLHLDYDLAPGQTLRASYSHRIVRPRPDDLNPYPVYQDAFDYSAGNPRLMPQETHSLEAGWSWKAHGASVDVTGYWRRTTDAFTQVTTYVTPPTPTTPGVLLTTQENLGRTSQAGTELAGSGKIVKTLGFSANANLYYVEIDAANLGLQARRSAVSYSVKTSLDWKPTSADTFQLSGTAVGKRLTALGERRPTGAVNIGWRRKLSDQLTVTTTVADLFNTQRDRDRIDQAWLHDTVRRRQLGRIFFVGFTRRFGTGKKAEDRFDYSDQGG